MGEINFFPDDLEIKDLKIILRLDLNVPIKNGIITDETRINKILPVINFLIKKKYFDTTGSFATKNQSLSALCTSLYLLVLFCSIFLPLKIVINLFLFSCGKYFKLPSKFLLEKTVFQ